MSDGRPLRYRGFGRVPVITVLLVLVALAVGLYAGRQPALRPVIPSPDQVTVKRLYAHVLPDGSPSASCTMLAWRDTQGVFSAICSDVGRQTVVSVSLEGHVTELVLEVGQPVRTTHSAAGLTPAGGRP